MTFQEALEQLRKEGETTYWSLPMAAMAEQIEANRLAIEELKQKIDRRTGTTKPYGCEHLT